MVASIHADSKKLVGFDDACPVSKGCMHSINYLRNSDIKLFYQIYAAFIKFLQNESDSIKNSIKKLDAIFVFAFIIGSNPPLYNKAGGAFVADAMLQYLLIANGFEPIRKNFLGLTEIELFYCYFQDDREFWELPRKSYLNSLKNKEVNWLFHPQDSTDIALHGFLSACSQQIKPEYVAYRNLANNYRDIMQNIRL